MRTHQYATSLHRATFPHLDTLLTIHSQPHRTVHTPSPYRAPISISAIVVVVVVVGVVVGGGGGGGGGAVVCGVCAVAAARRTYGSNELPAPASESLWDKIKDNLDDPLIKILCVGLAIILFLALFGYAEWLDGVGIGVAVGEFARGGGGGGGGGGAALPGCRRVALRRVICARVVCVCARRRAYLAPDRHRSAHRVRIGNDFRSL